MSDTYQDYRISALLAGADDAARVMRVNAGDSAKYIATFKTEREP